MTTTPGNSGTADFEGKAVPPYEGRRESADVDGEEKLTRDGANVGAATGPVESDTMKAPAETPREGGASPADEQPAAGSPGGDPGPASVGPAHYAGTTRGEDVGDRDEFDRDEFDRDHADDGGEG
jgi:hypothetical protein